ncbi:Sodium channel subunit beta-3 [Apodemus speciosus]|uniref:Sodium channel subunit beta-3 n=1 Tax=Apodemus speciosus TaxID=105296 RepID=A0ABQ0F492_APOSI
MKLRCISCMKREEVEATTVVEWFYRPEGDYKSPSEAGTTGVTKACISRYAQDSHLCCATITVMDGISESQASSSGCQIYEYRNGHQEVESPFQGRLQWNGSKDLQDVSITVLNVTLNDSGLYTCNVSRELEFEAHRPFVKTTRLIPLRVTEEEALASRDAGDTVSGKVSITEPAWHQNSPQAGEDFTSVVSEIMMYILLVFLTLWLFIEMIYCYRKVSKAEEAAQENAACVEFDKVASTETNRDLNSGHCILNHYGKDQQLPSKPRYVLL